MKTTQFGCEQFWSEDIGAIANPMVFPVKGV
jgi:hypothetical protein